MAPPLSWENMGKIFDPKDHELPYGCSEFAQSPQAIVLEDRVRVFFATRVRDTETTFLSHVAYADFDFGFSTILDVSSEPVLPLGELGTFDQHGIFPISVVRSGDLLYGYTTGWSRRVAVSVDTSIGLAVSRNDGRTFERIGPGPVMAAAANEPYLVADGFVQIHDGVFQMWYIFGTKWSLGAKSGNPERVYKIAHATSADGINWERNAAPIIEDRIGEDECQALPTVLEIGGKHHMFFCYRGHDGFRSGSESSYKIGYAVSEDMIDWTRDDDAGGLSTPAGDWDSEMQCYPSIVRVHDEVFVLYNGNQFGREGFGCSKLQR